MKQTKRHKFNKLHHNKQQLLLMSDISLILVAAVWGSSYGFAKLSLQYYPVLGFLAIRFGLTSLILLPVLLRTYRHNKQQLIQTIQVGIPLGTILLTIFLFETYGLFYTSVTNAAFLISLCIIITPFVEWLLLDHKPPRLIFLCALLSFIGVYLLTLASSESVGQSFKLFLNIGDGLILLAALARAFMVTMTKKLINGTPSDSALSNNHFPTKDQTPLSALDLTAIQSIVVFIGTLTLFWVDQINTGNFASLPVHRGFWLPTLYLVVFCTLFAFFVQNWAVKIGSPSRTSLLMGSEPLFGALFASVLFNEHINGLGWIGGGMITLSSVILVVRR